MTSISVKLLVRRWRATEVVTPSGPRTHSYRLQSRDVGWKLYAEVWLFELFCVFLGENVHLHDRT